MKEKFIERLNSILQKRNLSQADLSKMTGIRSSSISDWLNGKYEPKQDKISIIAEALNVSPVWLIGYDDTSSNQSEGYYVDPETAEFAEYLRTRPEARLLFSASRGISKEDMEKAVEYIELLKLKNK
ncbi:helix-turn-helix domain-containing protein [Veillonella parvula]|uniref:helix-turn-helix domain-containing protein n=1 Tax=Veillonella parvula TaxID=29466 RepID=UPI001896BE97|nr:MAG TPA: Repressor protein CI [Caudoviricetes sp.]